MAKSFYIASHCEMPIGTGMSALAQVLHDNHEHIVGSDVDETFFTDEALMKKSIKILPFNKFNITKHKEYFFIISHAYNEFNNEEVEEIFKNNYKYMYYSDFINDYFKNIKIGISGTHGKTTTTFLLSKLFHKDRVSYIIGDGSGKGIKESQYLIFEACEYKYHFINYDYDYLVINNIDYDHPDYYNNINEVMTAFIKASKKAKALIVNNDCKYSRLIKHSCKYTFGIKNNSYVTGTIIKENEKGYIIDIKVENIKYRYVLQTYGKHMIYNFLAAFTVYFITHKQSFNHKHIAKVINTISLPKRRSHETIINGNVIIDDYAHHPTEIKCLYEAIKQKYPKKDISIVFQPHTYTRSIFLSKEFIEVFCGKKVFIMNTFTSREKYDEVLEKVSSDIFSKFEKYDISKIVKILKEENQIIIFSGAGNINNEIHKLKNILTINE